MQKASPSLLPALQSRDILLKDLRATHLKREIKEDSTPMSQLLCKMRSLR